MYLVGYLMYFVLQLIQRLEWLGKTRTGDFLDPLDEVLNVGASVINFFTVVTYNTSLYYKQITIVNGDSRVISK